MCGLPRNSGAAQHSVRLQPVKAGASTAANTGTGSLVQCCSRSVCVTDTVARPWPGLRHQQGHNRAALIHGAVALGHLVQGQRQVEYLAQVDRPAAMRSRRTRRTGRGPPAPLLVNRIVAVALDRNPGVLGPTSGAPFRNQSMLRLPLLAMACLLTGCTSAPSDDRVAEPHGSSAAHSALTAAGYGWRTYAAPSLHLHYLPDSYAAQHIREFARDAEKALNHDLALIGASRSPGIVEVFLVNSREQARQLTGNPYMGQAVPGELSVFLVILPGIRPAFRHEIMHALSLSLWGTQRTGTWISEGVATWATAMCQGHSVDAIAAGFLQKGRLLPLPELAATFWEVDELRAYFTAGSAIGYLARTRGNAAVEALWRQSPDGLKHPLGEDGAEIERTWRAHLASIPVAELDMVTLRKSGC